MRRAAHRLLSGERMIRVWPLLLLLPACGPRVLREQASNVKMSVGFQRSGPSPTARVRLWVSNPSCEFAEPLLASANGSDLTQETDDVFDLGTGHSKPCPRFSGDIPVAAIRDSEAVSFEVHDSSGSFVTVARVPVLVQSMTIPSLPPSAGAFKLRFSPGPNPIVATQRWSGQVTCRAEPAGAAERCTVFSGADAAVVDVSCPPLTGSAVVWASWSAGMKLSCEGGIACEAIDRASSSEQLRVQF